MTLLFRLFTFVKHFVRSGNEHRLHSPFLFSLYLKAVKNQQIRHNNTAENFRTTLLGNKKWIEELDYGTGSLLKQRIDKIAKGSLKSQKEYLFLANLAHFLKPNNILELGTCFGLSTSYLKEGAPQANVYTLEGNPNRLRIAQSLLNQYQNVNTIEGNIDTTINEALKYQYDLIYIDANHTKEATLRYYNLIKEKKNVAYCIVFDDIYYSRDMNNAWSAIKKDQKNTVTLDFYHFGLVFFRKEMLKQHFDLRL